MLQRVFLLLSSVFLLSSCGKDLYFRKHTRIERLGVKLSYNAKRYPELKEAYDKELTAFIDRFNAEKHAFTLYRTDTLSGTSVDIQINAVRMVPVVQQAATFPLTLAACATVVTIPWVPLITPRNKSKVTAVFSDALCEPQHGRQKLALTSSGYFGSKRAQVRRHRRLIPRQYESFFALIGYHYKLHAKFYKLEPQAAVSR